MLTLEELRHDVESGLDRHGRRRVHRHAGPADGQARPRRVLPRRLARARRRGLQLPARARDGDGSSPGLRAHELGHRLRRLPAHARPEHAAPHPVARGDGARPLRRLRPRRLGGRALAAAGPEAPGARARSSSASRRCSARSSSSSCSRRRTSRRTTQHYRDLTPSVPYILDYHILASTYDEPFIRQIRNGMQGAGIRVETSKGEAWPGQHEINFRYRRRGDDGRQPRRLQERRQGDRAPERLLDHVHGQAGPHVDRQLVPHPLEPLARRRERLRGPTSVFDR